MGLLMEAIERIYLDTNVFITAFEGRDKTAELLLQLFVRRGEAARSLFVTSELSLSELLVLPYRRIDHDLINRYETILAKSDWLDVTAVEMQILRHAAVLRAQYPALRLPDAIHLSTAIGSGCSHILTADQGIKGEYRLAQAHLDKITESNTLTIIRPDHPTLTSLLQSLAA
jgi:predicted nucleic acid-binding protein